MVCQIFLYAQRASFWPSPSCRCARLPSQALRASSPTGRAKCTAVNSGKVYGKANSKSGPSCCMVTVKGAVFSLKPPRGARPQGAGGTSMGGGRDSIKTMRGQPFGRPRRGTLSFVTQKFFCFGAINNRRNYWLGTSFLLSHRMGVYPDKQAVSMPICPLYQARYGAPRLL